MSSTVAADEAVRRGAHRPTRAMILAGHLPRKPGSALHPISAFRQCVRDPIGVEDERIARIQLNRTAPYSGSPRDDAQRWIGVFGAGDLALAALTTIGGIWPAFTYLNVRSARRERRRAS